MCCGICLNGSTAQQRTDKQYRVTQGTSGILQLWMITQSSPSHYVKVIVQPPWYTLLAHVQAPLLLQ
jgi:hypothetical protein